MSIPEQLPDDSAVCDGVNATFNIPFMFFNDEDLKFTLTDPVDGSYTNPTPVDITGAGVENGGSYTLDPIPDSGLIATVERNMEVSQQDALGTQNEVYPKAFELSLDKVVAMLQQVKALFGRAVSVLPGDTIGELPVSAVRANNTLAFDSDGNPIVGPSVSAVSGAQQAATDAIAASQSAETDAAVASSASEQAVAASGIAQTAASKTLNIYKYTATGGETALSGPDDNANTLAYVPGVIIVEMNGAILEDGTDFTATTGTSITGLAALTAGDTVIIRAFGSFSVTAEMDAIVAEGASQVANVQAEGTTQITAVQTEGATQVAAVQAEGTTQTANMQTYAQQMADIVNNTYDGAFFEMDGNGDVMPTLSPIYSETYELDGNGDIQPL